MSRVNIHIFPTNIEGQTRLFKETEFTVRRNIVDRVVVIGLWQDQQPHVEKLQSGLEIVRIKTSLRKYRSSLLVSRIKVLRKTLAAVSLFQYCFQALVWSHRLKPAHVSCHYAAALPLSWLAARLAGATLEYLPHELETQRSGLSGVKKRIETWIEYCFIRSARNVVVVCDPIRKWYEDAYGLTNVRVVRNVPEREAVKVRPIPGGGFRQQYDIPKGAKIFIYQGLFSAGRGIETLLDTFAALNPQHSHLVLMGYGEGNYQEMINEATRKHPNIHFQPAVARDLIVSYSAGADVGILVADGKSLSYKYSLPNKFFEWAHAGLPIIVNDGLEYLASLVTENKLGWIAKDNNLAQAITDVEAHDIDIFSHNMLRFARNAVWEEDAPVFADIYRESKES